MLNAAGAIVAHAGLSSRAEWLPAWGGPRVAATDTGAAEQLLARWAVRSADRQPLLSCRRANRAERAVAAHAAHGRRPSALGANPAASFETPTMRTPARPASGR